MTQSSAFLLLAGVVLLLSHWSVVVDTQLEEVPSCLNEVAAACAQNALDSITPSACNWNIIVPVLTECVNEATSGCSTLQIMDWLTTVSQINETLNSPDCSPTCPNPENSKMQMDSCYIFDVTVDGTQYTSLEAVVNDILQSPTSSNPRCTLLSQVVACLTNATMGCTALMGVTLQRLTSLSADNASAVCSVSAFVGPTTSAPLAIFETITVPTTTTTTQPGVAILIGDGSNNGETTTWVVLIVLGSIVCVAIIVIVGVLIQRTVSYRKQAAQLDQIETNQELRDQNISAVREVLSTYKSQLRAGVPRTRAYRLP